MERYRYEKMQGAIEHSAISTGAHAADMRDMEIRE
jgi:hypothetical protein